MVTVGATAGTGIVSPHPPWRERLGTASGPGKLAGFLAITAQLGLLLVLLRLFEIEPGSGLPRILPLVFAGFVVHAALPLTWRLPFFLLLSLAAIVLVLGPVAGPVLILIGLVLVGLCHLPVAFTIRALLVALVAAGLAATLAGWIKLPSTVGQSVAMPDLPKMVLPVLGSMFMFRLVIYLYDLRHDEQARTAGTPARARAVPPASLSARLSYFFLLPNVCFLLFPVVDFRTYRRTYYDTDENTIYQRGVWWICLGLVYLLAYRLVYHYLVPSPEDVQGLGGIVRFMTSSYLVYLRVVGQFHLIAGLLCLFGFNLPPAHRYFLLAAGFTDFWRRARIEWKDFMVKVFYYPTLVPVQRRLGATPALVIATIFVFVVTWLLHAYQWFWLRGDFRLSGSDGVFWTIIGGCVLVNSLIEARGPRARPAPGWGFRPALVRAAKVVGLFAFMSVLWSYWSSPSVRIWLSYLTAAGESGPGSWAILAAGLLGLIAAGVAAQYLAARLAVAAATMRTRSKPAWQRPAVWRPASVLAMATVLLLLRVPATGSALGAPAADVVAAVATNRLNAMDLERHDRSYYEVLLDETRSTAAWLASPGVSEAPPLDDEAPEDAETGEPEPSSGAIAGTPDTVGRKENGEGGSGEAVSGEAVSGEAVPGKAWPGKAGPGKAGPGKAGPGKAAPVEAKSGEPVSGATSIISAPQGGKPEEAAPIGNGDQKEKMELAGPKPQPIPETRSAPAPDGSPATDLAVSEQVEERRPAQTPAVAIGAQGTQGRRLWRRTRRYERPTDDVLLWENIPSARSRFKGESIIINEWGMRDKPYSKAPPPRTYRMALLGTSMTVGAGVPVEQGMESLLEDRFNLEGPGIPARRYEILNFSVGGYGIMQCVATLDQKVFDFKPTALLVGVFSIETHRMRLYLSSLVKSQVAIPYPYVREKLRQAGVDHTMEEPELRRRLDSVAEDLVRWSYQHIAEAARARGLKAVAIVLPEPRPNREADIDQTARLAAAAGLPLIDLRGVYDGHSTQSLSLNDQADPHWNTAGHQLVANRVYELMRENDAKGLRLGFTNKKAAAKTIPAAK
ncbi:MAG: hypothetical protein H0T48_13950 [Gemmatimonadaceae bacterium]|nr:hypothetical protein [Gemmatimonadaceae bacterium]